MKKPTGTLLKKLRKLMKNTSYVPEAINAYIVPSGDAHQVVDLKMDFGDLNLQTFLMLPVYQLCSILSACYIWNCLKIVDNDISNARCLPSC